MVCILGVFDQIKTRTLESIENAVKAGKVHDPWNDTGLGYDAGWIHNELGRAQMFLLAAKPELGVNKINLLDQFGENTTTHDILNEINSKDPGYVHNLIKVFDFFENNKVYWCRYDLEDQSKIDQIKNIL
jgi:hypothetical protein